jgi:hypothetical protein
LPYLIPNDNYVVRLHFCDPYNVAGIDIQNVSINGTQVLTNFDVNAGPVTPGQANIQEFNTVADGNGDITIVFTDVQVATEVCGIEVETDLLPPPASQELQAWRGNTQVGLSWLPITGATGYNVKRSAVTGGPYTTIASNLSAPGYSDPTTNNNYYVVTALNSTGEGPMSNEAYPVLPFTLAVAPASVSMGRPGSGFTKITASSVVGFSGTIEYSGSGVPTGVTGLLYPASSFIEPSYVPASTVSTGSMLQFCASGSATAGAYPVTVTGTSGDYSSSATLDLTLH